MSPAPPGSGIFCYVYICTLLDSMDMTAGISTDDCMIIDQSARRHVSRLHSVHMRMLGGGGAALLFLGLAVWLGVYGPWTLDLDPSGQWAYLAEIRMKLCFTPLLRPRQLGAPKRSPDARIGHGPGHTHIKIWILSASLHCSMVTVFLQLQSVKTAQRAGTSTSNFSS
jgi:hypothetical protein